MKDKTIILYVLVLLAGVAAGVWMPASWCPRLHATGTSMSQPVSAAPLLADRR